MNDPDSYLYLCCFDNDDSADTLYWLLRIFKIMYWMNYLDGYLWFLDYYILKINFQVFEDLK